MDKQTKNSLTKFPKGFFEKSRPTISTKEALKDVIPLEWNKSILEGKKKTLVKLAKEVSQKN